MSTTKTFHVPHQFITQQKPSNFLSPPSLSLPFSPRPTNKPLLKPTTNLHPLCASPHSSPAPSSSNPLHHHFQQALTDTLQTLGLTREESARVASNAPKYVEMLVSNVRELDEISGWSGEREIGVEEKVRVLVREKGGDGKVAVLESVGLSLSLAMYVARGLRFESLSELVYKVKYIKEIFFPGNDNKGLIARNARRMMMHLSIPIGDDLQQTLSFFEKIEARRGGLNMLVSGDASFCYLVESFPRLLMLSVESHIKPMVEFFESIGIPTGCSSSLFLLYPPIIFSDIEAVRTIIQDLEKVGAEGNIVGKMLLKYPWILSVSIQGNYITIVDFFNMEKVPKCSIDRAIRRWPFLLGCSTTKLKVMVEQLGEFGVRNKKLGQVIATSPQLLLRKPQEFQEVVSFLEELGFDNVAVGKLLGRCPEVFATSIKNTMKKKLEFLVDIGISKEHFPWVIRKYPELFVSDTTHTLLPRLNYLMKEGLSERDISLMIRRFSPLLGYSVEEVLRPKLDFLINSMGKPVKDVVEYPRYFSYSLEKKIKPRFWVLKSRNMECSLKDMLAKNDEEFAADFMGVEKMRDTRSSPKP